MSFNRRNRRTLLVVMALIVVVNVPVLHGWWTGFRLDRSGVDTVATVVDISDRSGSGSLVVFRFDPEVDPEQTGWVAGLKADAADDAEASGTVQVRVLPGSPSTYRVRGEQGAGLLRLLTLFADLVLVGVAMLIARRRPELLTLVALEDVRLAKPGGSLEQVDATTYEVVGEVTFKDDSGLVIDVGDQSVRVELDGHANPVGWDQPARVRARLTQSGT